MDVKYLNPFIEAFNSIMGQMDFNEIKVIEIVEKDNIKSDGLTITVGIVGDLKGNVVYLIDDESGKRIASKMMMGFQVDEMNDMAQSALSELSNMITASAGVSLSALGVNINISTPTLVYGHDVQIKMNCGKTHSIKMKVEDSYIDVNVCIA